MKRSMTNLMLTAMLLSGAGLAQDDGNEPGRGVARISLLNGDVSMKRGDSGDVVAAAINAPLLVEDRVMTGPGARAEVQFDFYHRIRLAGDSEIRLSQLDEKQYQIQVARGLVTFSALKGGDAQVEVSTPAAALRPVAHGEYRISVMPDGSAQMTVRSGEAEIFSASGTQTLRPGRTMMVRLGEGNRAEFQLMAAIPRDDWDEFNKNRDKELRKGAEVYQYVSRDVYGAEDLNGHGDWAYVAPYGWSWSPYVAAGWSPYRYGRWMWEDWYGWTWVSYDPWGWAPYHYGRWFYHGSRWCWYPGGMGMRHYWSPALVGWVGWNSWGGFSGGIGIGWGAVGWVPLAPFEPFHRWWGRGYYGGYRGGGFNNTTIINNVNITNVYRNARVNNGVMAVNGTDFSRGYTGRPLRMGGEELARANMAQGMLPVAPTRDSLRASDRAVSYRPAESRGGNERFYSRGGTAARVERVPFDQQRSALERVASRGATEGRMGTETRRSGIAGDGSRGGAGNVSRQAESMRGTESQGWRRADEPARGAESRQGGSNWGRFGDPAVSSRSELNQGKTRTGGEAPAMRSTESDGQGGWRSFGSPSGSATGRSESPRMGTPRTETSPQWSTGGGRTETPRMDTPRTQSPRMDTPRTETSPQWSTGGGRTETPRTQSPRMETPRMETPRTQSPRMETPRSEPSRGTGGGVTGGRRNDFPEPMARGGWSTGGGSSVSSSYSRSGESRSGLSRMGGASGSTSWSSGGGVRMDTPRSSGGFGGGSSMRSAPSYGGGSSMRSAPSFGGGGSSMRSAPSFGGGGSSMRSAPSFGGGGGMRSAPSFGGGGGGMRGGGSMGGGGGMRSGGGGGSRGGGRGR